MYTSALLVFREKTLLQRFYNSKLNIELLELVDQLGYSGRVADNGRHGGVCVQEGGQQGGRQLLDSVGRGRCQLLDEPTVVLGVRASDVRFHSLKFD